MRRPIAWQVLAAGLGLTLLLLVVVVFLPTVVYPALSAANLHGVASASTRVDLMNARYGLQNNFRGQLVQILAALFVVGGAVATWQQVRIAREGQITERFTRAIEHLGSDKLDVRLGGIYALERLALNSPADRASVTPILGAFVRGHAPWNIDSSASPAHPAPVDGRLPWLTHRAVDVQTAMHVLARRPGHPDEPRLFLSNTDLRRMQIFDAKLSDTYLRHANLARAWIPDAHLERSQLVDTDLRQANLRGAHMDHADLRQAHLEDADLRNATFRHANLRGANLTGARLDGADLTDIQADDTTIWPADYSPTLRADEADTTNTVQATHPTTETETPE